MAADTTAIPRATWRGTGHFAERILLYSAHCGHNHLHRPPALGVADVLQARKRTLWQLLSVASDAGCLLQFVSLSLAMSGVLSSTAFSTMAIVTVIALVFSSMAGYALARLNFVGRGFLFNLILFTMTIPSMLTLVPLYIMVADFFGWSDNYLGIIAPSAISTLGIFWFRQFFLTLPQELFEAGRLDGLSDLGMLFGIAWPLSRGVVLMVGLLVFMQGWNDLLWPLMVEHAQDYQTASQVVALFVVGGQAGSHVTWQMAMAMVLGAPILIAYVFAQRHIVEGIATTGLK